MQININKGNKMNIAIIYHDADFDGKLSNEVCRHWLNKLHPTADIVSYGWDYGRPVPVSRTRAASWKDNDLIYIVDLSVDELVAHHEFWSKIVWIDHHKSAIEKWDVKCGSDDPRMANLNGYRIDGVAACRLCWQWFLYQSHDGSGGLPEKTAFIDRIVNEPELLRLAGEYDIWDHRDPDAKVLQFGLRALTDHQFRLLVEDEFETSKGTDALLRAIQNGRAIKSYCDKQNDEYATQYATTVKWHGLTWCALNIGQRGNSDLLRAAIKPEHDACIAWRHDGTQAYVSLYHAPGKEHLDLSVIAKAMGGGGHRGACGFRETLTWIAREIYGEGK